MGLVHSVAWLVHEHSYVFLNVNYPPLIIKSRRGKPTALHNSLCMLVKWVWMSAENNP